MGLEIRYKLVDYVGEKIRALQVEHGQFFNISVARTNAMKHMCNYFQKASLSKLFFCFPDPCFKKKHQRRRIINSGFLAEYAYLLKKGGRLYAITDVKDLHDWHVEKLQAFPLFRQLSEEEMAEDLCVQLMSTETEEGKKVARNKGSKYACVFERK